MLESTLGWSCAHQVPYNVVDTASPPPRAELQPAHELQVDMSESVTATSRQRSATSARDGTAMGSAPADSSFAQKIPVSLAIAGAQPRGVLCSSGFPGARSEKERALTHDELCHSCGISVHSRGLRIANVRRRRGPRRGSGHWSSIHELSERRERRWTRSRGRRWNGRLRRCKRNRRCRSRWARHRWYLNRRHGRQQRRCGRQRRHRWNRTMHHRQRRTLHAATVCQSLQQVSDRRPHRAH